MKQQIREFLKNNRAVASEAEFNDDDSLLEAGVIDSMTMIDLIAFLEGEFGIAVDDDDMTPENFDSVNAIAAYVQSKQSDPTTC